MNKKRWLEQRDFNNSPNGYRGWHDGDYSAKVNWGFVGLYNLENDLKYYIR